jgi:energy-coupling factor transporter ATP-binding protein EcfA2
MPEAVIEVSKLRYRYPDGTAALKGVDFQLDAGETVAVLGANGSGKTTFLLHLLGLLLGEGEVRIRGVRVEKKSLKTIRTKIGVLFQDSDDQLFMPTVEEDVSFGPLNMGLAPEEARQRARQALEMAGMEQEAARAPYHLSAGQKRRVALAGVLAMDPEIILLDEHAPFLDPPSRAALTTILAGLPQAKLIVTHDIDLARELATRAVFFEDGRLAADGDLEEIVERFHWHNARTAAPRPLSLG